MNSEIQPIRCIFCQTEFSGLKALKEHSATCPEHPAVKQLGTLSQRLPGLYWLKWEQGGLHGVEPWKPQIGDTILVLRPDPPVKQGVVPLRTMHAELIVNKGDRHFTDRAGREWPYSFAEVDWYLNLG